jgi:xanthine permease
MPIKSTSDYGELYGIDERPPTDESVLLGMQHVLAMLVPNIAPALIIAGTVGLATGQTAYLVQIALLFAGLATIVQTNPIKSVGARLPIVMGTSFTFVGALIAIATQYGLATAFGAAIVGAFVEIAIAWNFEWFQSYFTPLVNGLIVIVTGLYLIPIGIEYLAGGVSAANYGAPINLAIGLLVFIIAILLNQLFSGFLRILSLVIAIVVGYLIALVAGMVNLSPIAEAAWFAVPVPLKFGVAFKPVPILVIGVIYITTTMETVGHISALTAVENRSPTVDELKGGLLADGIMSSLAGIFGGFPNTSFAQNIGVVTFTGVMSRFVVAIAGVILVLLGFVPKIGALVSTIPYPVLGGATLVMFGMILSSGFSIIYDNVALNRRNMTIIAAAVSLGLGVAVRPEALSQLPRHVQTFFGNAIVMAALVSLILDNIIPKEDEVEPAETETDVLESAESTESD